MRNIFLLAACFASQCCMASTTERDGFILQQDVAQYKGSDYANVVHVARGITVEEAFNIAESNQDIDYFVYTKGGSMVLEIPSGVSYDHSKDPFGLAYRTNFQYDSGSIDKGYCRVFNHGDTVFFKKEGEWLSSAPGLADAYFKR